MLEYSQFTPRRGFHVFLFCIHGFPFRSFPGLRICFRLSTSLIQNKFAGPICQLHECPGRVGFYSFCQRLEAVGGSDMLSNRPMLTSMAVPPKIFLKFSGDESPTDGNHNIRNHVVKHLLRESGQHRIHATCQFVKMKI